LALRRRGFVVVVLDVYRDDFFFGRVGFDSGFGVGVGVGGVFGGGCGGFVRCGRRGAGRKGRVLFLAAELGDAFVDGFGGCSYEGREC